MWRYDAEKAFPYECPFCGCGHAFPQEECDRCHKIVDRRKTVIHTMMPVVNVDELEDAVNAQFGCEIAEMRNLLFSDDFSNDSYQSFWYGKMEIFEGRSWQNEEQIRLRNLVRAYLQDTIPDYDRVLVDVSW